MDVGRKLLALVIFSYPLASLLAMKGPKCPSQQFHGFELPKGIFMEDPRARHTTVPYNSTKEPRIATTLGRIVMGRHIPLIWMILVYAASSGARITSAANPNYIEPDHKAGSCTAVVVSGMALAHTTQFLPVDRAGKLVGKGDATAQTAKVLESLAFALREAKSSIDQTVKLNVYLASAKHHEVVRKALARRFGGPTKPAVTYVVTPLPLADALVAMDAVAAMAPAKAGRKVKRVTCKTVPPLRDQAHLALLPSGAKVYLSGQSAPGDLGEATAATLEKLKKTLENLDLEPERVVHVKVFLQPMQQHTLVRRILSKFFEGDTPPTSFVEWTMNSPVEIEMIASGTANTKSSGTVSYPAPSEGKRSPLFSPVAVVHRGKDIYLSSIYADMDDNDKADAAAQTRAVFERLREVVSSADGDLLHLVKATYYLTDEATSKALNEIRPEYLEATSAPAASKVIIAEPLIPRRTLYLDMIAVTRQ